jgi:hypothetical protein
MAKAGDVKNPELRAKMEAAFAAMRAGKGGDAVHALAEAFVRFVELHPEVKGASVAARGGRQISKLMRWPNLGANMNPASARAGAPEIVFTRERFSSAEALTYYQFVLDEILAAERDG